MLYLSEREKDQLVGHSRREYPDEACGILAGKGERVQKIYQMINADKSTRTFFMDPREQLRVMKEIRSSGLDFIGIYHSHPESRAFPSTHDVKLAYYPDVWYVIISLRDKDNPEIKAYKIVEGKIEEESIGLNPEGTPRL